MYPHCNGTVTAENLKYAVGPKVLNLDISDEHQKMLLDYATQSSQADELNIYHFVQSLRIKDAGMDIHPLFDGRSAHISRLKTKKNDIDSYCDDPELVSKISRLTMASSLPKYDTDMPGLTDTSPKSSSLFHPRTSSKLSSIPYPNSSSESEFMKTTKSPLAGGGSSVSLMASLSPSTKLTTVPLVGASPPNNSIAPISPAQSISLASASSALYPPPDFSPTIAMSNPGNVSTTKKKKKASRHRDPVDIMHEEIELAKSPRREGTKREPAPITDWGRVGVGDGIDSETGLYTPSSSQFVSQSMATFSPMTFEPGRGAAREGVIGDAQALHLEREHKRNEKYARSSANFQVTQSRLELNDINEKVIQLRRNERSAQGMLQYSSSVYIQDQKELKRQPLLCMQKKPNPKQFNVMWSGTFHPAHHVDSDSGGENRNGKSPKRDKDFTSTLLQKDDSLTTVEEDRKFKTVYATTYTRDALIDKNNNSTGHAIHHRPGTSTF